MKKIITNYIYNSIYQILTIVVPLITTPYLARIIGADGLGKYAYSYSVAYMFFIFIKLGLITMVIEQSLYVEIINKKEISNLVAFIVYR